VAVAEFSHERHRDQEQFMPRAYWKGYLRLSLVTCPIELFPATSQSEKNAFSPDQQANPTPAAPADGR
jgi:hypothetical protein